MQKCSSLGSFFSQKIYPLSSGKFWWDMIINTLSLMNAIYVPIEIAFSINTIEMDGMNYFMDVIFFADIIVNFRTIYFDYRTNDPISDSKMIALNYIRGGRFFVDLIATLPIELISEALGGQISKSTLKLIGLIKLTRLLRLGRILTFIKMKKSFKHGLRFALLFTYLFLIIHFICCGSYYVFSNNQKWLPGRDIIPQETIVYDDQTNGYFLLFYQAALFLQSNDVVPTSIGEIIVATFCIFLGSTTLGLLIGQFASIINDVTKKQRVESEKMDFIQGMMFSLRLPENIQNRILDYYECNNKSQYIVGKSRIKILAPSLVQKISDHQLSLILLQIPLLKSTDNYISAMFSKFTVIEIFLPGNIIFYLTFVGDVILKQGDEGSNFNIILDGILKVVRENKDIRDSKFQQMAQAAKIKTDDNPMSFYDKVRNKFGGSHSRSESKDSVLDIERLKKFATYSLNSDRSGSSRKQSARSVRPARRKAYVQKLSEDDEQYTTIRELGCGRYFGEISLLTNLKVTATVYTKTYVTIGQIPKRRFLEIIQHSVELKKRLYDKIRRYKDKIFQDYEALLTNAFLFKNLNQMTLHKITFLFRQERHLKGTILIRKRERSDKIFFVKKGSVEVRLPYTEYDIQRHQEQNNQSSLQSSRDFKKPDQPSIFTFAIINTGGYFNLSSALLKKFSLFEFVIASNKADIMILNAADLVSQSKKSEDLYFALQSHAILYEVEGQKYDFNRQIKKIDNIKTEEDLQARKDRNNKRLISIVKKIKPIDFLNLQIFGLIDELFNLRRDQFITRKRKSYLKELRDKRLKNTEWYKSFMLMKEQANKLGLEFTEETEEQLMKIVDQIKDEEVLIRNLRKHFNKTTKDIELQIDRFVFRKCRNNGMKVQHFYQELEQDQARRDLMSDIRKYGTASQNAERVETEGPEYQSVYDEDYIASSKDLIKKEQNQPKIVVSSESSDDTSEEYEDMNQQIQNQKKELAKKMTAGLAKEKLLQLEKVDMQVLENSPSIVLLTDEIKSGFKNRIKALRLQKESQQTLLNR